MPHPGGDQPYGDGRFLVQVFLRLVDNLDWTILRPSFFDAFLSVTYGGIDVGQFCLILA